MLAAAARAGREFQFEESMEDGYDTDDNAEYCEDISCAPALDVLARVAEAAPSIPSVPQATHVLESLSDAKLLYRACRVGRPYAFEVEL